MPSVKNFVTFRSGYGRLEMRDFPLDDDEEGDDVSLDSNSTPRPERRLPTAPQITGEAVTLTTQTIPVQRPTSTSLKHVCKDFKALSKEIWGGFLTNPAVSVVVMLIVCAVSVSLGWYSLLKLKPAPVIDKSIKAFNIPNHKASRMQDALDQAIIDLRAAWRSRGKRDVNDMVYDNINDVIDFDGSNLHDRQRRDAGRKIHGLTQGSRKFRMTLVYLAQGEGDHNMFTEKRLRDVRTIEKAIMDHPQFTDFCYINYGKLKTDPNLGMYDGCAPLNSLLTYFFPSVTSDRKIHYDALGSELDDINKTLTFAMTRESFYWYVDDHINVNNKRSRLLRSEVHFGAPFPGYTSYSDRRDEQYKKYKEFVTSYVGMLEKASTSDVRVLYGGNEIFDYEVDKTFWNDLMLAFYSVGFICIFVFVLTSFSPWLTFWGIISILLSFPLALFFYRVVFNNIRLGILNGVAAFVIIGIGVDDVFVFINTFRQSYYISNLGERMMHTTWIAGKATFFTSFTTAAAFAANIASSIPAVHDFGLFMSLVVACCWVVVVLMMPPVLNIWHRAFSKCESFCYSCNSSCCTCTCCTQSGTCLKIPNDVNSIHSTGDTSTAGVSDSSSGSMTSQESDVPMLEMDEELNEHEGGWPTYLGLLNHGIRGYDQPETDVDREEMLLEADDPLLSLEKELVHTVEEAKKNQQREGFGLNVILQGLIYHGIARPVIRGRIFMAVLYVVLLAVSIGLLTQLRPATKPPQLFRPDTNLQMLADLAANFSSDGIKCDECSGFYKEGFRDLPATTTTVVTPGPPTKKPAGQNTPSPGDKPTPAPGGATPGPGLTPGPTGNQPSTPTPNPTTKTTTTSASTSKASVTTKPTTTTTTNPITKPSSSVPSVLTNRPPSSTTTEGNDIPTLTLQPSSSAKPSATPKPTSVTTSQKATTTTNPTTKPVTTTPKPTSPKPTTATRKPDPTRRPDQPKTPAPPPLAPRTPAPAETKPPPVKTTPDSVLPGFDPCEGGKCDKLSQRPNLETGAAVYVVFGLKGIDRSNVSFNHVLTERGSVIYDEAFEANFSLTHVNTAALIEMCRICKLIANNHELVKPNGSQCIPAGMPDLFASFIRSLDECKNLPTNTYVNGKSLPVKAIAGYTQSSFKWLAFAFESTTFKGQSSFSAYKDYQNWEAFIRKLKEDHLTEGSPLHSMYQTSSFWKSVMMEIIAVSSAISGLVFSLIICVAAVAIFTGHVLLIVIVILTILGVIAMVLGVFLLVGWEMGAVEAVSLSILVGSSVDYCVHLVEGYLLAGQNPPQHLLDSKNDGKLRRWRTRAAVAHIGVSIVSSAVTTIVASIPLTQTIIVPFSKFGEIVALNTTVSIFYTVTFCATFLSLFGPARFTNGCVSTLVALGATAVFVAVAILGLFLSAHFGHFHIPGPSGEDLFPVPSN